MPQKGPRHPSDPFESDPHYAGRAVHLGRLGEGFVQPQGRAQHSSEGADVHG